MKKQSFLHKLENEGKLQIVESSDEICEAYLEKSERSLKSSKVIYKKEDYENAVALAYYSMYYIVLALFFKSGIKCKNHTATIMLLERVFDIDNDALLKAKKERIDKQYYIDFSITKDEVGEMIKITENFNSEIFNFIDTLNKTKIDKYKQKIIKILE